MSLTKTNIIDRIEVCEDNTLQVRQVTRITEDDVLISETYHRRTLQPGDSLDGEDARVIAVAHALWSENTPPPQES